MKFALPVLPILVLGLVGMYYHQSKLTSINQAYLGQIAHLVNEDVAIIDAEIEQFQRELEEIFSWADKYHFGKKLLLILDTVDVHTVSMLSEVAEQMDRLDTDSYSVSAHYVQHTTQLLEHVRNYLTIQSSRFALREAEIATFLANLAHRLSWEAKLQNFPPLVQLKLLEAQVVRCQYTVMFTLGNTFCNRGLRHADAFPAVLNFGKLNPILQNEEAIVELGVQSYDFLTSIDSFKLVVQGDTLLFDGYEHLFQYSLPTEKLGDNQLVIKLLSINPLTGEAYESETRFDYYVNETLN